MTVCKWQCPQIELQERYPPLKHCSRRTGCQFTVKTFGSDIVSNASISTACLKSMFSVQEDEREFASIGNPDQFVKEPDAAELLDDTELCRWDYNVFDLVDKVPDKHLSLVSIT